MNAWLCRIFGHDWVQIRWGLKADGKAMHRCKRCGFKQLRVVKD